MATPTLTSVSPSSGPPGTAITCSGSGFEAGARVGCPVLVEATFVGITELQAEIPASLSGPGGGSMTISVNVVNPGGEASSTLPFVIVFPATSLQSYTDLDRVCGEVPGFKRGGRVGDRTISTWITSYAQRINGVLRRRGISLNPSDWPSVNAGTAMPSPASVLEMINRQGAAASLAAALAGDFTQGEWGLAKTLRTEFDKEMKLLALGEYDNLFKASAATADTGPQLAVGDITDDAGEVERSFTKGQVF